MNMKINLSNLTENRYSRLELLSWWKQSVMKNSRILVVGCGALGNEIIKNLTMLGAGHIYAVDSDKVEKSNLTRSVLLRAEDEGKSKAETVCLRAKEINSEVELKFYTGNVFELGLGVFRKMDMVICGLDNREARLFVNQSCYKTNKPWIDGAIEGLNGTARMFLPNDGACYECTLNDTDYQLLNKRKSCLLLGIEDLQQGKVPTTPTVSSIIAGIQVQEAVKYLHGIKENLLIGKGFIYDGMKNSSYLIEYPTKENCDSHYTIENIEKININFNDSAVRDLLTFGKKYFGTGGFDIEFGNEILYALEDENGEKIPFTGNLNLLKANDVKRNGKLMKCLSFHKLREGSELMKEIQDYKLMDLKLPLNDIPVIRKEEKETGIEFNYSECFNTVK